MWVVIRNGEWVSGEGVDEFGEGVVEGLAVGVRGVGGFFAVDAERSGMCYVVGWVAGRPRRGVGSSW